MLLPLTRKSTVYKSTLRASNLEQQVPSHPLNLRDRIMIQIGSGSAEDNFVSGT